MKKLLGVLGSVILLGGSTGTIANVIQSRIKSMPISETKLLESIKDMNYLFETGELDANKWLRVYDAIPTIIYYAVTKESLEEYMRNVRTFEERFSIIDLNEEQVSDKNRIAQDIVKSYNNWNNTGTFEEMHSKYSQYINLEKEKVRNIYYAYNQISSKSMLDDMDKYQPFREQSAILDAKATSLESQIAANQQLLDQYKNMEFWRDQLKQVFTNWINALQEKKDAFDNARKNIISDAIDGAANYFVERSEKLIDKVVKKAFKDASEEKVSAIRAWVTQGIKNRKVNENGKMADWLDRSKNDTDESNDSKPYTVDELCDSATDEYEKKSSSANTDDKKKQLILDICKQVFELDDFMFGNLHSAADDFTKLANGITSLSDDVKNAFKANGLPFDDGEMSNTVDLVLQIASSISSSVLNVFGADKLQKLASVVFEGIDSIKEWINTFDVMATSQQIIDTLTSTMEEVTKIPPDLDVDPEVVKKEILYESNLLRVTNVMKNMIEDELKNSKLDEYISNQQILEDDFNKYKIFLNIYSINKKATSYPDNSEVIINSKKYYNNALLDYDETYLESMLIFNKLITSDNAEEKLGIDYGIFVSSNLNFENLRKIIDSHREDFK